MYLTILVASAGLLLLFSKLSLIEVSLAMIAIGVAIIYDLLLSFHKLLTKLSDCIEKTLPTQTEITPKEKHQPSLDESIQLKSTESEISDNFLHTISFSFKTWILENTYAIDDTSRTTISEVRRVAPMTYKCRDIGRGKHYAGSDCKSFLDNETWAFAETLGRTAGYEKGKTLQEELDNRKAAIQEWCSITGKTKDDFQNEWKVNIAEANKTYDLSHDLSVWIEHEYLARYYLIPARWPQPASE